MAKGFNPNLGQAANQRLLSIGILSTTIGIVFAVPFYNMVLAPTANRALQSVRDAGFLPQPRN